MNYTPYYAFKIAENAPPKCDANSKHLVPLRWAGRA